MKEGLVKGCSQCRGTSEMHFLHLKNLQNSKQAFKYDFAKEVSEGLAGMETACPPVGEETARCFKTTHL